MKEYTVRPGDTMSAIATEFYGDGSVANVMKIWEANLGVSGVGPAPESLHYETAPFVKQADGTYKGQPVVLKIPD